MAYYSIYNILLHYIAINCKKQQIFCGVFHQEKLFFLVMFAESADEISFYA